MYRIIPFLAIIGLLTFGCQNKSNNLVSETENSFDEILSKYKTDISTILLTPNRIKSF